MLAGLTLTLGMLLPQAHWIGPDTGRTGYWANSRHRLNYHAVRSDGKRAFASAMVWMEVNRSIQAQAIISLENYRPKSQDQVRSQRARQSEQS